MPTLSKKIKNWLSTKMGNLFMTRSSENLNVVNENIHIIEALEVPYEIDGEMINDEENPTIEQILQGIEENRLLDYPINEIPTNAIDIFLNDAIKNQTISEFPKFQNAGDKETFFRKFYIEQRELHPRPVVLSPSYLHGRSLQPTYNSQR